MRKNLLNTALILGVLFLVGCGGGSSDSANETIEKKMLGVWEPLYSPCKDIGPESMKSLFTITADTIEAERKTYSEFGCNEDDLIYHDTVTFSYQIGDPVQTAKGYPGYEFDFTKTEWVLYSGDPKGDEESDLGQTRYSMIAMLDIDQHEDVLVFANGDDSAHDGSSPDKRENILDDSMIKVQ